jgi:p-hydroxybenzoic acid efflux pump subunit AaeB
MVTRTEAIPVVTRWHWMPQDLFGDLRLRYGIKMGLAGLIALFCTQVLRLPHDNWAILTVLVLMSAQFVGSITFKAIMRVIGTIAGALVGIWLVGDYTNTPAIFLPVLFLVVALASYKFGQLGASQVPYAYFLLGLTTLTIATDGVTDPTQAWQIGLDRSEEILVGIMSSLLVTSVLWPRYPRFRSF